MQAPVLPRKVDDAVAINVPVADASGSATPVAGAPDWSVRLKVLALALLSGVMLFLCHFPVAWGWLGWVALVPLLVLVRVEVGGRWRYFCAWLAGSVYLWPAISWMTVADMRMVACWALLSFYCSLYFPLAIGLVRRLERGTNWPLFLTFPAVWTALECWRAWFGTGFSWYLLGYTQQNALPVIQIADLGGVFAVGFVVAAVNVAVFEAVLRPGAVRRLLALPGLLPGQCRRGVVLRVGLVGLLLAATLGYGAWRLADSDFEPGPRIALVQGNVDQRLRIAADRSWKEKTLVHAAYVDLSIQAARLQPKPDLIVWPETSFPEGWVTVAPHIDLAHQPEEFLRELDLDQGPARTIGRTHKTNVLLGLNTLRLDYKKEDWRRYNSALLIDARGNDIKRYDKMHRVPFGEYVPFRDWIPFMNTFAPYDHDYSISCGDGLTRFALGKYHFGVLICYEDTVPFMGRDYGVPTGDGPAVDFLVNISNDGWFDGSSEHEEHLAISRFRAIEARRAVARAVNMGVSAVIDGNGRVLAPVKKKAAGPAEIWEVGRDAVELTPGGWQQYKQSEGILVVDIPVDRRTSVYAQYGDWLPVSCGVMVGGGLVWGWRKRRRKNQ
jgi:apolipoprotein N-acyltransferase